MAVSRLRILILAALLTLSVAACASNPTPHPSTDAVGNVPGDTAASPDDEPGADAWGDSSADTGEPGVHDDASGQDGDDAAGQDGDDASEQDGDDGAGQDQDASPDDAADDVHGPVPDGSSGADVDVEGRPGDAVPADRRAPSWR